MPKIKTIAAILTTLLMHNNLAVGDDSPSTPAPEKNRISITAKGTASAQAEIAFIDFSIQVENENAVDAEKVLRKKSEILCKDLDIPLYNNIAEIKTATILVGSIGVSFKSQPIPSTVYRQPFSIMIKNINKSKDIQKYLATLIDHLGELGFAESLDVRFQVENSNELRKQAYLAAIESAKSRAKMLAEGLGKTLGSAILIKDNSTEGQIASSLDPYSSSTDVRAVADIYIEFEIKP